MMICLRLEHENPAGTLDRVRLDHSLWGACDRGGEGVNSIVVPLRHAPFQVEVQRKGDDQEKNARWKKVGLGGFCINQAFSISA